MGRISLKDVKGMLKWLKKVFRIFFLYLIPLGSFYGAYYLYQRYERHETYEALLAKRPTLKKVKDGTSISATWCREEGFEKKLSEKYPWIYTLSSGTSALIYVGRNIAVPGLVSTKAYDFSEEKMNLATNMTPQGIAFADEYMLIPAYDGLYKHNPVIWVLNKQTGKYIKTLQMEGRPRLSGIAYDPIVKNIRVTSPFDGESVLVSFSLRELKNNKRKGPVKYSNRMALPGMSRVSAVTYFGDQLFVGFFNMYKKGIVSGCIVARSGNFKGLIITDEIRVGTGPIAWSTVIGSANMDKQIQGITFHQDKTSLGQPYGSQSSKLYIFPVSASNPPDEKNAEKVIELPLHLE